MEVEKTQNSNVEIINTFFMSVKLYVHFNIKSDVRFFPPINSTKRKINL